jgi:hypothetical protein
MSVREQDWQARQAERNAQGSYAPATGGCAEPSARRSRLYAGQRGPRGGSKWAAHSRAHWLAPEQPRAQ